jgi:hypothetical protein
MVSEFTAVDGWLCFFCMLIFFTGVVFGRVSTMREGSNLQKEDERDHITSSMTLHFLPTGKKSKPNKHHLFADCHHLKGRQRDVQSPVLLICDDCRKELSK